MTDRFPLTLPEPSLCHRLVQTLLLALCVASPWPPQSAQTVPPVGRPASSGKTSSPAELVAIQAIESKLKEGHFREAQLLAEKMVRVHPDCTLAWTYLGMAHLHFQRQEQATQAFERAVALRPSDPRPYLNLALLYATKNEIAKAVDCYQKALSIDNRNGTAYYNYGRLLMDLGRFDDAAQALERAVEINQADTDARIALEEAIWRGGRQQEAHDRLRSFLERSDVSAAALISMGGMLLRMGDLDSAKVVLTRALSMDPNSAGIHLQLSKLYLALNQPETGISEAKRAAELSPTSLEANLAFAEALINVHHYSQAHEFLRKIQPRFEKSAGFQYTLGVAAMGLHDHKAAIVTFEKAVQLDPQLDLAHFLLGTAYFSAGDLDKAESHFQAAVALNAKDPLYFSYLARVYDRKGPGFEEKAVVNARKALALNPGDIDCGLQLAKWEESHGNLSHAREILEGLVKEAPTFIPARVLLARLYYHLNLRAEGDEQQEIIRSLQSRAQTQH